VPEGHSLAADRRTHQGLRETAKMFAMLWQPYPAGSSPGAGMEPVQIDIEAFSQEAFR